MNPRNINLSRMSLSIAAALGVALSAHAQPPQPSDAPNGNTAGIKAAIDPVTGRIRNLTPEESAALSRETAGKAARADLGRSSNAPADNAAAALTVRKAANGAVSVRVPRSAMTQIHGRIGADGKIIVTESGHTHAAAPAEAME